MISGFLSMDSTFSPDHIDMLKSPVTVYEELAKYNYSQRVLLGSFTYQLMHGKGVGCYRQEAGITTFLVFTI